MAHFVARLLFLSVVGILAVLVPVASHSVPVAVPAPTTLPPAPTVTLGLPVAIHPERVVYLAGGLSEKDVIAFTANHAASGHPGFALLDGPKASRGLRAFLASLQPEQVIPVGSFADSTEALSDRLGVPLAPNAGWDHGPSRELWKAWFPHAEQVVVTAAEPRRLLLQSACLAGALRAPLWILRPGDEPHLSQMLGEWQTRRVLAAGFEGTLRRNLAGVHVIHLPDEHAVSALYVRQLVHHATTPNTLVVANPADTRKRFGAMSTLAPLLAVRQQAPLLLTDSYGDDTARVVEEAVDHPRLRTANHLLIAADLEAIPMERRPNPVPGKDTHIEMEPLTPLGNEPYSFATGRVFHEDPAVVLLLLARQRLLAERPTSTQRKALVVSNPGDSLPLLEMFSRNTARELAGAGYQTTTLLGDDVSRETVRRELQRTDLFLWEGHHSTLIKDYGFADWNEPLPPSFIFLQSCLALTDAKTHHLFERGSLAVAGSSTRIYSATGGAFSLAVGSSRVDLQACKLEYSIVSPK